MSLDKVSKLWIYFNNNNNNNNIVTVQESKEIIMHRCDYKNLIHYKNLCMWEH